MLKTTYHIFSNITCTSSENDATRIYNVCGNTFYSKYHLKFHKIPTLSRIYVSSNAQTQCTSQCFSVTYFRNTTAEVKQAFKSRNVDYEYVLSPLVK